MIINPVKGVGPSGTRNTCANLDTNLPEWQLEIIVETILIIFMSVVCRNRYHRFNSWVYNGWIDNLFMF